MYCFDEMVEKSITVQFKLGLIQEILNHPTLDFYIYSRYPLFKGCRH